ncbi:uncharacterized protein LOC142346135 [Convolutriloba macropyga]|uniref:uncharacterized protein LOC142346135 n=1 Tax=Convolutriloba macropyga TaxID=536237 RepID=UPI003F51E0E0
MNNITTEHLPAVKIYKAHVKLITGSQPKFCKARKILLPLPDKFTETLEQMIRKGILEPVQPGGVTNESPVVWQRKTSGELRLCVVLKVHINGKVMDDPIPDMGDDLHQPTRGRILWQNCIDDYYQTAFDEETKDMHNQHISGTVQ